MSKSKTNSTSSQPAAKSSGLATALAVSVFIGFAVFKLFVAMKGQPGEKPTSTQNAVATTQESAIPAQHTTAAPVKRQAIQQCLSKIQVRLEKVMEEPMGFLSPGGDDATRAAEEKRLLTFANSAKAEIGDIMTELERAGASKEVTDNGAKLIDSFFSTYKLKITLERTSVFYIERGDKVETGKRNLASLEAYRKMLQIKQAFSLSE